MMRTYKALLHGDRLEWLAEAPKSHIDGGELWPLRHILSPSAVKGGRKTKVLVGIARFCCDYIYSPQGLPHRVAINEAVLIAVVAERYRRVIKGNANS